MKQQEEIPIHSFSKVFKCNFLFQIIRLQTLSDYDSTKPHRHNYYEIFLFEKGGGEHLIDFKNIEIKDKSVHFVSPGQVHQVKRKLNTSGYLLLFSREYFYLNSENRNKLFDFPFFNNASSNPTINLIDDEFEYLFELVKKMFEEYINEKSFFKETIHSYLKLFTLMCNRYYHNNTVNTTNTQLSNHYQEFRVLLERNFENEHQVNFYAEKLNLTPKKLSKIIKQNSGRTALENIHQRIILEAKRLIKYSDHSIKEIAFFLSFDDPSHFNKFFKKNTQLTPKEYRAT